MALTDLAAEMACACALARAAGRVAIEHYGRALDVRYKAGDKGPVTVADRAANDLIVAGLRQAFPNDAILAEEWTESHAPAARQHAERLWCVDPIDGTREFIAGTGQFAIMLGLAVAGRAQLGVVYNPLNDSLWRGAVTPHGREAAFEQGGEVLALAVSTQHVPHLSRLVRSRHGAAKAVQHLSCALGIQRFEALGSVGLKMARIAAGQAEIYVCATDRVQEWDTCGPEAIVRAAGGSVTDLFGAPLRYNKKQVNTPRGMLASNGALHPILLKTIDEATEQTTALRRMRQL